MRLWSLDPAHLDRAGLLAGWREALLAQAVLAGRTKGYRSHPQLERFRATDDPIATISAFLAGLQEEASARGYRFDRSRILEPGDGSPDAFDGTIPVPQGQLAFEWAHLGAKLERRSPEDATRWRRASPTAHRVFRVVPGAVAGWERG